MIQAGKKHTDRVYAFIDKQTLNLITRNHGWILDLIKFRKYLRDSYGVEKAFLLVRYFDSDKELHKAFVEAGYNCLFISDEQKDENFALDVVLRDKTFDKAILVTGNEGFAVLVEQLVAKGKLSKLFPPQLTIPPAFNKYREFIVHIGSLRKALEKGR
jgi:hypothetical protein